MSSSSVTCFTTSHFYLTSEGHLCTHETCILQTSLKVSNFERRFMVCSQFKVSNNFLFLFDLNCMLMVNSDELWIVKQHVLNFVGVKSILRLVLDVASFNGWITILVSVGMKLPHLSFKESICLRMNFSLQLRVKGQLGKLKKKLLREKEKLMNCM